uniref:Ovule protein n=1 Tax=Schistosoma curassoni TaxID=6186 RepID=A0A183JQA0_9TREM
LIARLIKTTRSLSLPRSTSSCFKPCLVSNSSSTLSSSLLSSSSSSILLASRAKVFSFKESLLDFNALDVLDIDAVADELTTDLFNPICKIAFTIKSHTFTDIKFSNQQ